MSDFFLRVSLHPCYVPADKGMAENVDFLKQVELKEYSAPALDVTDVYKSAYLKAAEQLQPWSFHVGDHLP